MAETYFFLEDRLRIYCRCKRCELVSVPSRYHLNPEQEKQEYDKHQNSPDDRGYRQFLNRLAQPLLEKVTKGSYGLDFGCGPGPTLSCMLEEQGTQVELYDLYYFPQTAVLAREYDFVTATEVVEHLREPASELERMWACVKPGGVLGIMTRLVRNREAFSRWHYKNDPTHIQFFSLPTLHYLAEQWRAGFEQFADDAFIFSKAI